ncbi:MAG: transglutaminase domain-containing protein [candidate division KSB1 bacterium]|nr:transglutaminase domain-containing protein [candidate division KSB1 bacterium]
MKTLKFQIAVTIMIILSQCLPGGAQLPEKFQQLIREGQFTQAQQQMRQELATNLTMDWRLRHSLAFEIERLDRIRKDFTRDQNDIMAYIQQYLPTVTSGDLKKWEAEQSLECLIIDGEKRYFKWAGPNLFRINRALRTLKAEKATIPPPAFDRLADITQIIAQSIHDNRKFTKPVRAKVTYTVDVDKDAVPAGKIIRCWLPFPREIHNRQMDVRLVSSEPARHIISPNDDYLQRTIYLEKAANCEEPTRFQVVFEFTNHAVFEKIDPQRITVPQITPELQPFVVERYPHICFTPALRELSSKIVGSETNPYFIAQKIFRWIDENIPWASAREYSTIPNITEYVLYHRHGDCGMKTLFFITLCRLNGIPTRWQSGWTIEPGSEGMHDWGEIYFEPYGWLPIDVTYGLQHSNNESVKWFFLGGMDAYRLIVCDDYSQNLYPAKIHFRSETVDFQRGELEWEGGNLYFDRWNYEFNVELLN